MTRKAWAKSKDSPERLRGVANQERRKRIALRDGFRCYVCGELADLHQGQADHVIPLSQGGNDDESNLRWICIEPCHRDKSIREAGGEPKFRPDWGLPVDNKSLTTC